MKTNDFILEVKRLGFHIVVHGQRFFEIHQDNQTDTTIVGRLEMGNFNLTINNYELGKLILDYSFTPLLERGVCDYQK